MKKLKIVLLAFVLGFVLVAGQPHAVVATPSSGSGISLDNFSTSTADYGVDILSVAPNAVGDPYDLQADGTYHVISSQSFNLLRINITVTGINYYDDMFLGNYTQVNSTTGETIPGTQAYNETLDDAAFAGELYLIVNGQISRAAASLLTGINGVDVALTANFNVVTFLYVGRNQDGTHTYGSDTVVIRIGASAADLADFRDVSVPVSSSVTDAAAASDPPAINTSGYFDGNSKQTLSDLRPDLDDLSITHTDYEGNAYSVESDGAILDIVSTTDNPGSIEFSGTVDTSGFEENPIFYGQVLPATQGLMFVQDANGLTPLEDVTSITILTGLERNDVYSSFSLVALANYGNWNVDYGGTPDLDGQIPTSLIPAGALGSAVNSTVEIGEAAGWTGGIYGASDFISEAVAVNVQGQSAFPETSLVSTTVTEPGFGAVIAFVTVGAIAYVAPRLRKD